MKIPNIRSVSGLYIYIHILEELHCNRSTLGCDRKKVWDVTISKLGKIDDFRIQNGALMTKRNGYISPSNIRSASN